MSDNIFPPEEWKPSHITGVKELIEEGTKFRAEIEKRSKGMFQESCVMCDQLRAEVERLENEMPILMHLQAYNDIKKAVAARCIDLGTPDAIKEEFGL